MANFYLRFLDSVERFPDAVAVEMQRPAEGGPPGPGERWTYRQMREMSGAVARWLRARKVPAGSRCAILALNGPRWLDAYLGTIAAGSVIVPFDTNFSAEQVAKLLTDSGSGLLFVDLKHLPLARRAVEGTAVELFLLDGEAPDAAGTFDRALAAPGEDPAPAPAADDAAAVIVYTSGTTSDPKGVMLTHGGLAAELAAICRVAPLSSRDALLGVLPLFHVLSQMANLLLPLAVGARTVFLESTSSAELVRALRERGITIFVCVPQFFYLIHERIRAEVAARGRLAGFAFRALLRVSGAARSLGVNLGRVLFARVHRTVGPDMRLFVTGGAKMDPGICRDLADMGFSILQAYGLTETTGAVFSTSVDENVIGSVGRAMHGVRVRLAGAVPSEEAGGASVGEIEIGGPTLMKGYYNRPEATAEVLKDGWLKTGDLGYLDARGNLFIAGRRKEMIVLSSGKNVYPEEIEAHYLQSPFIREICVMGVQSRPGEPFSERLHGVVVPDFDLLRERRIVNAAEVIRFDVEGLSAKLPATKRILSYEVWPEALPRTTTRKVKRFEVERRVRSRRASEEAGRGPERERTPEELAWAALPDVARALELVAAATKGRRARVHPRDNIELDLGLDSVERVELLGALRGELGAGAQDWSALQVFTVRELVDAVRARVGAPGAGSAGPGWDAVLRSGAADPAAREILADRPWSDRAWWAFFRLVNLAARALYRLEVTGLEKLPREGAFILAPNHQSYLDGPVLISALPFALSRRLFYVGTSELFGSGLGLRLARSMRLIPIDPDVNMVSAMKAGAYGLAQGKVLVLFPEGERSIDGEPKTFKKGAAILSTTLGVPICPVALEGFFEAWPRDRAPRPSGRLRIAFGDPLPAPGGAAGDAAYAAATAALKDRVVALRRGLRRP